MKKLITLLSALTLFTTIGSAITETTNVASAKTVHHKKKKIAKKKKATKHKKTRKRATKKRKKVTKKRRRVVKKRVVKKRKVVKKKVVKKKVVKKATPKKKTIAKKQTKTDPMINTSNKQAIPLITTPMTALSIDDLRPNNVKNIVSTTKNLPNKISNPLNKDGSWNMRSQLVYYYSNSKYDKSEKVNPKKLTRKQLIELNNYANQLVNGYRKEIGINGFVKTDSNDITLVTKMIEERTKHNVDVWDDKYDQLAMPKHGTFGSKVAAYDYSWLRNTGKDVTTMLQLKTALYDGISMLLNSSYYGRNELLFLKGDGDIHSSVGVQYRSQTLRKKDPEKLLTFIITTSNIDKNLTAIQ